MKDWVSVPMEEVLKPSTKKLNGVALKVCLTPYEIPTGIRGGYDKELQKFAIEFRYLIEDSELETKHIDSDIEITVGKDSGRIHGILVDVNRINADSVSLELMGRVSNAVDKLPLDARDARLSIPVSVDRREAVKQILRSKASEFVDAQA